MEELLKGPMGDSFLYLLYKGPMTLKEIKEYAERAGVGSHSLYHVLNYYVGVEILQKIRKPGFRNWLAGRNVVYSLAEMGRNVIEFAQRTDELREKKRGISKYILPGLD